MGGERRVLEDGAAALATLLQQGWDVVGSTTEDAVTRYELTGPHQASLQISHDQTLGVWHTPAIAADGSAGDFWPAGIHPRGLEQVLSSLESVDPQDTDRLAIGLRHLAAVVPAEDNPRVLSVVTLALDDPRPAVHLPGVLITLYWQRSSACRPWNH